jgi:hypothetical protein
VDFGVRPAVEALACCCVALGVLFVLVLLLVEGLAVAAEKERRFLVETGGFATLLQSENEHREQKKGNINNTNKNQMEK